MCIRDSNKEDKKLILSAKEILREKAEEERKNKISNIQPGFVTEGIVESLQPYGAFAVSYTHLDVYKRQPYGGYGGYLLKYI